VCYCQKCLLAGARASVVEKSGFSPWRARIYQTVLWLFLLSWGRLVFWAALGSSWVLWGVLGCLVFFGLLSGALGCSALFWAPPALCRSGLLWAVLVCFGLPLAALSCLVYFGLFSAAVGCSGLLFWAALGSGLLGASMDYPGVSWCALGCHWLLWAARGCSGLFRAARGAGLPRAVQDCSGLLWLLWIALADLICSGLSWVALPSPSPVFKFWLQLLT